MDFVFVYVTLLFLCSCFLFFCHFLCLSVSSFLFLSVCQSVSCMCTGTGLIERDGGKREEEEGVVRVDGKVNEAGWVDGDKNDVSKYKGR